MQNYQQASNRIKHFTSRLDTNTLQFSESKTSLFNSHCISKVPISNSTDQLSDDVQQIILENIYQNFNALQQSLNDVGSVSLDMLRQLCKYRDFIFCQQDLKNNAELSRAVYCCNIVNHLLSSKAQIKHQHYVESMGGPIEKDQGFRRARVLIAVPFKDSCLRIVNTLIKLCSDEEGTGRFVVDNKARFVEEYSGPSNEIHKSNSPGNFHFFICLIILVEKN